MHSTSLLWGRFWCSIVHYEEMETNRHAGSWLSRLPWTKMNWCRYADWRPNLYHQIKWVSSLVAVPNDLPLPPAWKRESWTITKPLKYRREVLHLYRWSTHTHTCSEIAYRIIDVECSGRAKTPTNQKKTRWDEPIFIQPQEAMTI